MRSPCVRAISRFCCIASIVQKRWFQQRRSSYGSTSDSPLFAHTGLVVNKQLSPCSALGSTSLLILNSYTLHVLLPPSFLSCLLHSSLASLFCCFSLIPLIPWISCPHTIIRRLALVHPACSHITFLARSSLCADTTWVPT